MKQNIMLFLFIAVVTLAAGCDNSTDDPLGTDPGSGLSASSTSLSVLLGEKGGTIIGGGSEPYSVISNSNTAAVDAQIVTRQLVVTGIAEGTAAIKVKDSSSPSKTVTISVSVKVSFTTGTAGSVSFTSNRGNYSVNGIGELRTTPPTSGEGAIALQEFGSNFILSYTVHTPTSIDLTLINMESNTGNYAGTYNYPGTGKVVEIGYFPNVDPNDTTFLDNGYALTSSATAVIDSITAVKMKGSFSGTGFFYNKSTANTSLGITVSNGLFNVPIYHTGSMSDAAVPAGVLRTAETILRKHPMFR